MSELCRKTCPVIKECHTRVNSVVQRQQQLLKSRSDIRSNSLMTVGIAYADGTVRPIAFVPSLPALQQVESQLRSHQLVIEETAAGATDVELAEEQCEKGPALNLKGRALLSAATLAHGMGIMPPSNYWAEREQLTELFPSCSSSDAYAALAQVPVLGHRYSR